MTQRQKWISWNRFAFLEGLTEKSVYGLRALKALQEQAVVRRDPCPAWSELDSVGLSSSTFVSNSYNRKRVP